MSKLYATIKGSRGEASRCGSNSIQGHIRGWDLGVAVEGDFTEDGELVFRVYRTGGSNGGVRRLIAEVQKIGD